MIFSKSANERLWDSLLKEALIIRAENELNELKTNAVPHNASEGHKKKMKKILSRAGRKEAARGIIKSSFRFLTSAAAALGIAFSVLLTQNEVYAAVYSVMARTVHPTHDEYVSSENEITVDSDEAAFNENIRFGYIPEGYELRTVTYLGNMMFITYESNEGEVIYFTYSTVESSSFSVDNEHHDYSTFISDGIEYHYYDSNSRDYYNSLLWADDSHVDCDYIYCIESLISKDEIVKIAKNLKY